MADWQESVHGWKVTIQRQVGLSYEGSGERVFIEKEGGPDSIPAIGSSFYDPADDTTYPGILLTSIEYTRTHSACGYGRTANCSYSSSAAEKQADDNKETYGVFSGGLKTATIDGDADWAWYTDNAIIGSAINMGDFDKMVGRCAENLDFIMPTGVFTKRIEKSPGANFTTWVTTFNGLTGKVNLTQNASLYNFPIGCVLLNFFDASRPLKEDFDDEDEYIEALTDWKIESKLKASQKEVVKEIEETDERKEYIAAYEGLDDAMARGKEKYEDFAELALNKDLILSSETVQILLDTEIPDEILYYLASNPDESERISELDPVRIAKEVGKIEVKLSKGIEKVVKQKKQSSAPEPISPVKVTAATEKDPNKMSPREYRAWRENSK